jgi:hypothetical protein
MTRISLQAVLEGRGRVWAGHRFQRLSGRDHDYSTASQTIERMACPPRGRIWTLPPLWKGFGAAMSSSPLGWALERRRGRRHPVAGGGSVKMRSRHVLCEVERCWRARHRSSLKETHWAKRPLLAYYWRLDPQWMPWIPSLRMRMQPDKVLVIYDHRVRWLAAMNMAFLTGLIWVGLRFCSGTNRYILLSLCIAFSLFWIRDLLLGFRLRLSSNGTNLTWQEGKETGTLPLGEVRKVLIGVRKPANVGFAAVSWTFVRFHLRNGTEVTLPPGIGAGLRSQRWRHLRRLVSHIRTISNVPVEAIDEPDLSVEGWQDEHSSGIGQA